MATVKHISSKNADYGAVLRYMIFQHDEMNNRPVRDENGNMVLRERYLIEGIECSPETFQIECIILNKTYGKNQQPNDVKSHHYIISFDPKDADSGKLTMAKAQELGMEIAQKYFRGHQAIVCTHEDGHNHSHNIHCHIVINSLRKHDVEKAGYMSRPYDHRAGYKHVQDRKFLRELKSGVMKICEREGLSQVDLLSPAKDHITDREYRKQMREEDARTRRAESPGSRLPITERLAPFQTELAKIRSSVRTASLLAHSETEFVLIMRDRFHIEVTESRGRWGYKTEGAERPVRARRLGAAYEKEAVITAVRSVKQIRTDLRDDRRSMTQKLEDIRRQASTVRYLQDHGITDISMIDNSIKDMSARNDELKAEYAALRNELKETNALIHYRGQLFSNRQVYLAYRRAPDPEAFREQNYSSIALYEAADRFLRENAQRNERVVPSLQELRKRKGVLESHSEKLQDMISAYKAVLNELGSVRNNVEAMLGTPARNPSQRTDTIRR